MVSVAVAYLLALCSAIFNGSFAAVQKHPWISRVNPHPQLINFYVTFGLACSCFLMIPFLSPLDAELKFNALGALSGALFTGACSFTFFAIPRLGLAVASSVWCGTALLTSFLWGVAGPDPVGAPVDSWPGSIGAVLCLLIGIVGIVFHAEVASKLFGAAPESDDYQTLHTPPADLDTEEQQSVNSSLLPAQDVNSTLVGIAFAILTGVFGGSINVPSVLTKKYGVELIGVETLPSFGVGCLVSSVLALLFFFGLYDRQSLKRTGFAWKELLLPCFLSGLIWNMGNVCSIYAIPGLGFAVGQPLMQTALLFSGLLGIFVFKEITGAKRILTFFLFAVVLLTGAVLLGLYGKK